MVYRITLFARAGDVVESAAASLSAALSGAGIGPEVRVISGKGIHNGGTARDILETTAGLILIERGTI